MIMSQTFNNSRRDFLKNVSLSGGGLLLGFSLFDAEAAEAIIILGKNAAEIKGFNSYVSIGTDGIVTIFSPNPELGQNIKTSFAMIVADELEADWAKVKVVQAHLDTTKFDRQLTGGSGAIPHSWKRLRTAGATAKQLMITAAAKRWNVPEEECHAEKGLVIHKGSGRKLGYGDLAMEAAGLPIPSNVKLKDSKDFKLIGKSVKNVENKSIITGKPLFGIDVYREGMVFAALERPPAFGLTLKSANVDELKQLPGITDVVIFKNNVAIVGKSTWDVFRAKGEVKAEYESAKALESSSDHDRIFTDLLNAKEVRIGRKDGDVEQAFAAAAKIVKAEYECPFVPHNPLEPMNFFADVKPDKVELVGPTQTPQAARKAVSDMLKIPESNITVEITRLGGGFGRRLKWDYVLEAAELSSIIKKPVKLMWTREDDMTGGSYRPAVRYRFEAALDEKGEIIGYKCRGAGINVGNSTRPDNFPSGSIDHVLIEYADHNSAITTGAWRAPVTNFLAFAEQSFLDEVAKEAGRDPVQMRLDLLKRAKEKPVGAIRYDIGRMETVIRTVAEKAQWGKKTGVHQGFSVYFSHASYVAQIAEVVMKEGKPSVQKIVAVSDCGVVINQSGALQQVMGAITDGLGTAMYGKLSFRKGEPEQKNFNRYRLIRMKEIPAIDASFIDNGKEPTGLGEPALPPTGGAVANAIFKATGVRVRKQPFIEQAPFKV
jgi:isoquinoline 1-oxidoreductase beta subunit